MKNMQHTQISMIYVRKKVIESLTNEMINELLDQITDLYGITVIYSIVTAQS